MMKVFTCFALLLLVLYAVADPIPLPDGEHTFSCQNGQAPTVEPPDTVICPTLTPIPPTATPTATPGPAVFLAEFEGDPATPEPFAESGWDTAVHSRDRETWVLLDSMAAGHTAECGPPPGTHVINTYEDAVFRCRDHFMTAINARGYGVIYNTPDHLIDFSAGEAVLRFDVSTLRTSNRDWIDLWLTPYEDNLVNPLEDWLPDLSGEPKRAIHIRMKFGSAGAMTGVFEAFRVDNFVATKLPQARTTPYDNFFTTSAAVRQIFELRISSTHIRFGMPAYNLWWVDTPLSSLGWDTAIVQLGHHSYNPLKDCPLTCSAGTWHWDNVFIQPAVPFTILPASRRVASPIQSQPVTFTVPAPPDSHLRFSGIGGSLEISPDCGTTWQPAQLQAQEDIASDHFRTYWTPIPAGTTCVGIRGQNWWGGSWHARDISIWSTHGNIQ